MDLNKSGSYQNITEGAHFLLFTIFSGKLSIKTVTVEKGGRKDNTNL